MMAQRWIRYDNLLDQFVNAARVASKQDDCEDIISRRDGALKHNCCKV